MDKNKKLPISAIIVGFNEENLIKDCLESVLFCDEILFFDLGSADNTLSVAKGIEGIKVQTHGLVPYAEYIHCEYKDTTKHDWILILDPDEKISDGLKSELIELFDKGIPDDIAAIHVPWIFYFKKKRLLGTPWGGVNAKSILFNRHRNNIGTYVHRSRSVIEPYKEMKLEYKGNNFVYHFWMQNYKALLQKHLRYLKHEPESQSTQGVTTTIKAILKTPYIEFKRAFISNKGYKDKSRGLFLSAFWAWYQTSALIGLYRYQLKNKK